MEQSMCYNFSASVPVVEGHVTYLKFATPEAPGGLKNAVPTITRDFSYRNEHHANGVKTTRMAPASTQNSGRPDTTCTAEGIAASSACDTSGKSDPSGQTRVVRRNTYNSISSGIPTPMVHRSKDTPSTQACNDHSLGSLPQGQRPSFTTEIQDELLIRQLHREERKCQKTNAEKENGIEPPMLSYFEMDGEQSLSAPPPELSGHPKLQIGDLFCYRQASRNDLALWIWSRGHGPHCDWQRVFAGFTRPADNRRLAVVGSPKRPTWVTESWYRRRFLKQALQE